jgi:hypothetical protein
LVQQSLKHLLVLLRLSGEAGEKLLVLRVRVEIGKMV